MKRVFKLGILLGFIFSLCTAAQAAPTACKINGVVTDSISGEAIPFVTIGIENNEGKVLSRIASDALGKFMITASAGQNYRLVVSSVGYGTKYIDISLSENEKNKDLGTIKLTESSELSEVTVVAQKPLIKSDIDKITYDMEADPDAASNNALDMLRKVPMITVDAEENIRLNGQSNYKVLVNGKSSAVMSGDNVKEVLKSMPANTIKNIEVITNPSSKYEAEGVGGIINIITVSRRETNGIVGSVGANADTYGGFGGNVYLSSQIGKFAFSGRYSGSRYTNGDGGHSKAFMETFANDEFYRSEVYGSSKYRGAGHNMSIEASYEIDTLNLISFSAWGWLGNNKSTNDLNQTYFNRANDISSQYRSLGSSSSDYGSVSGTLDYQHSFAKKDRTLTASYQFEYNPNNSDYTTENQGIINSASYIEKSKNKAHGTEQTIQIDYFDPLTDMHQIEGGVKYIMRCNVSDGDRDKSIWDETTEDWKQTPLPVNDLDYTQHILGVYAGYVLKVKKWSGKVGARLESTWNDGRTTNYDVTETPQKTKFDNNFFNIVPYVTLSWQPRDMQTFKLSYTQRLSRPGIWQLNPFKDSSTPMQLVYGNPNLESEISHTFSLGYTLFTAKGLNLATELNGRIQNNGIEQTIFMDEDGVANVTYDNIGKARECNLNVFFSGNIIPTLSLYTNLSGGYGDYSSKSAGYSNKGWNYNGYLGARWNAWKDGAISANVGYYSGFRMLVGTSAPMAFCGFSVSQSFFEKKLQLNLSVSDPFSKERKFTMHIKNDAYRIDSYNYDPCQYVRLGVTYRFGQMKESVKKARRSITNDDVKSESSGGASGMGGGANIQ